MGAARQLEWGPDTRPWTVSYRRRKPEDTALYRVVLDNLDEFLASRELPRFVGRTLRRFLDCGILAKGFLRVRCGECREESPRGEAAHSLVAYSCKDRSFPRKGAKFQCPGCTSLATIGSAFTSWESNGDRAVLEPAAVEFAKLRDYSRFLDEVEGKTHE